MPRWKAPKNHDKTHGRVAECNSNCSVAWRDALRVRRSNQPSFLPFQACPRPLNLSDGSFDLRDRVNQQFLITLRGC
jgi:hypothetical protein